MVKSPFAALNWGVHSNDSALYLVTATGASSTSMEGLESWGVTTPTIYKTFGEAVNAFARSIYQGWIWRLENVTNAGLSNEEMAELTYFRDWVWYGNDMSETQAFNMNYLLNDALREVLNEVFMKEVFETENFYQNGSLISTNPSVISRLPVIPVETQQELTDLEPKIKAFLEQKGVLAPYKSVLLISLVLTYYDGYETDEKCEFLLYRIGGSQ